MGRVKSYYHNQIVQEVDNGGPRSDQQSIDQREDRLYQLLTEDINLLAREAARLDLLELDNHQY